MTKYYKDKMTAIQKRREESKTARKRLMGEAGQQRLCSTMHRMLNMTKRGKSIEPRVEMEIRFRE